jgi:hypothetical protein
MTMIEIKLPDELAERARSAGLLSDNAIQQLLEDAMRRRAGRAFMQVAKQIHASDIPEMTDEEVVADVKSVRAERSAR